MLRFIKLVLLSLVGVTSAVFASETSNFSSETFGTVYLEIGGKGVTNYTGTGVIINKELNILTNYHVVDTVISGEDTLIKVCFTYNEAKKPTCIGTASVEKYDSDSDLALLNTYIHSDYLEDANVKFFYDTFLVDFNFVLQKTVKIAENIYVFGYPGIGGDTITYTSGKVSGFEDFYIKTDVKVSSGNSGGAAYNEKGEIIGIVTAVSGGEGNIGWMVNASTIETFLENTIFDKSTDSAVCGTHQYKTDKQSACQCEIGFVFNATKTSCIPDIFYDGCGTIENNSFYNPAISGCTCAEGFDWKFPMKEDDYTCIKVEETPLVDGGACSSGSNNYYDASAEECNCKEGFIWEDPLDVDNLVCIEGEVDDLLCEEVFGEYSHYNEGDALCYCDDGYEWSTDGEFCVLINESIDTAIDEGSVFVDVFSYDENFNGIEYVKNIGLVNGYNDGSYKPAHKITRAEFTKIILLAEYSTEEISRTMHYDISDIKADDWYYDYVNFAKQKGVITGYADNTFRPNKNIAFGEAAKILVNVFFGYRDIGEGEQWWLPFTQELENAGVKIFDVSYDITRGEMATLIYQIANAL